MDDELSGLTAGERLQAIRERRGKSRAVVAGLVGRSEEWLKSVERGRRGEPRYPMMVKLASVLDVDVTVLVSHGAPTRGLSAHASHESTPAIREALERHELTVPAGWTISPKDLEVRAADAWRIWHASSSPRADLASALPALIRDTERAVRVLDGAERRVAYQVLAQVYGLAEQAVAWVAEAPLVWLVADRGLRAAQQADDPVAIAGAAWVLGNVQRASEKGEEALRLVDDAARLIESQAETSVPARALLGALRLHGSITAARMGREGDALRLLDQGDQLAKSLPAGYVHPWSVFGKANVDVTAVSVHADLRQGGRALQGALAVDPDEMPSKERRARLWLEASRAYSLKKDKLGAVSTLTRACDVSTEAMTCHPLARSLAAELIHSGSKMVESDARAVGRRLGLAAV